MSLLDDRTGAGPERAETVMRPMRSPHALQLREVVVRLAAMLELAPAAVPGVPLQGYDRARLAASLRAWFSLLLALAERGVAAGDRYEASLVLRENLAPTRVVGPADDWAARHRAMLRAVAATWALAVGEGSYSAAWRNSVDLSEHEALVAAAGLFHGPGNCWNEAADRDLAVLALETMAKLLVGMGYVPSHDLAASPVDAALSTRRLFSMIALATYRTQRTPGGEDADRSSILADLAERVGVDLPRLNRGLRLWAAADPLVRHLVEVRWRLCAGVDFTSPLDAARQRRSESRRHVRAAGMARVEQRRDGDPRRSADLPPGLQAFDLRGPEITAIGPAGAGVTTFWNAQAPLHRDIDGTSIAHGSDVVVARRRVAAPAVDGDPASGRSMVYRPSFDLPEMPMHATDFHVDPFDPTAVPVPVRASLLAAKAYLIFLDERFLGPGRECEARSNELSNLIAEHLRLRSSSDPCEGPLPVGFVLNKIDHPDMLGADCGRLLRHEVLGPAVRRELFDAAVEPGRRGDVADPGSPMRRLVQAIEQQPENNTSPRQQQLLAAFLQRFPEALAAVLRYTTQFEFFLVAAAMSAEDGAPSGAALPRPAFGADRPLRWLGRQLYGPFLRAAIRASTGAWERTLKAAAAFDAALRRYDHLAAVRARQVARIDALEQRLAGRVLLRRYLQGRIKAHQAEVVRLGQALREVLAGAGALIGLELGLAREPFTAARERLGEFRPVWQDLATGLQGWRLRYEEARIRMRENGQ